MIRFIYGNKKDFNDMKRAKKLSDEYMHSPEIHNYIIGMPRKDLLEVQEKEDEYKQLLKRRELLYQFLLLLTKVCDLIDE